MLRLMCGVTRKSKFRKEHFGGTKLVAHVTKKDPGEITRLVRANDEKRARTHSEKNAEDGYTRKRKR